MTGVALVLASLLELAASLHRSAPAYLTPETARDHAAAAVLAGAAYEIRPEILLALAYQESRYRGDERTAESGGRFSCGPLTPEPIADERACAALRGSLLVGYLAGAAHLRDWLRAMRGDERRALLGYAGGYRLLGKCREGPIPVLRAGREVDLCRSPERLQARARRIASARGLS